MLDSSLSFLCTPLAQRQCSGLNPANSSYLTLPQLLVDLVTGNVCISWWVKLYLPCLLLVLDSLGLTSLLRGCVWLLRRITESGSPSHFCKGSVFCEYLLYDSPSEELFSLLYLIKPDSHHFSWVLTHVKWLKRMRIDTSFLFFMEEVPLSVTVSWFHLPVLAWIQIVLGLEDQLWLGVCASCLWLISLLLCSGIGGI